MKAWITPGIQPIMVNIRLIKKVVPNPCFRKTDKGGSTMLSTIVRSDM